MSLFKKLFGTKKNEVPEEDMSLPWIEASQNPLGMRLLDLRPVTGQMLATSSDPQMATNAVSYNTEDGSSFAEIEPADKTVIEGNISIPVDGTLAPGVLFIPKTMEHKWAIYYRNSTLIFVRSWQRQVFVTADTTVKDNQLLITTIKGKFTGDETPQATRDVLRYLLISYAIGEVVPAPLPQELESAPKKAALWAFSMFGNLAKVGTFLQNVDLPVRSPLRSHSLLHIAVARGDINEIEQQVQNGLGVNSLAADGLAPLHWSIASQTIEAMKKLLELGADPDVRSVEGATPIMNAVQSNKIPHIQMLLEAKADVNAKDSRGFTSLHRAAEMGRVEVVKLLLDHGADRSISANDHTALSFAENKGHKEIVELLQA